MIKVMTAKYRGRDAITGAEILPGDEICFDTVTRKAWHGEPGDLQVIPDKRGSYLISLGDQSFIRNKAGRCIDAPCCGCCTI